VAILSPKLRERGLRGLPGGPRTQTTQNPSGLTAREVEVLALVAERLRNAERAGRALTHEKRATTTSQLL
jgi:hypothetical protein